MRATGKYERDKRKKTKKGIDRQKREREREREGEEGEKEGGRERDRYFVKSLYLVSSEVSLACIRVPYLQ